MSHKIFFTPGPTQLYHTVRDHLNEAIRQDIPSISHRGAAFQKIFQETRENLTTLLDLPDGHEIYFTSSANEIWERIIQNLVKSSSHHFVNGAFARKFYDFALNYHKSSTIEEVGPGEKFRNLAIPEEAELIGVTLNETSIGYAFEPERVYELKKAHPEKLLALDGVSALPSIAVDFSMIDTAFFSVQKCFGMPSGLGVWIVNQACIEKAARLESEGVITGSYHRLSAFRKNGQKNQTPETPNVLGLYLLGKVAGDMLRRGIETIRNETLYKSTVLYQTIERHPALAPFVKTQENRSRTVVVAECKAGNQALLKGCEEKGWIVGKGYGDFKETHIRIANFPMHSKEQIEQLCDHLSGS